MAKRIVVSREWEFETTEQRDAFMEKFTHDPTTAILWYNTHLLPKFMGGGVRFKGRAKD